MLIAYTIEPRFNKLPFWYLFYIFEQIVMRIIAKKTIREFWESHPDSEQSLKSWYQEVSRAEWKNPRQVKQHFSAASIIGEKRVVFNICGNRYRLITHINYLRQWVFIRFIGTHNEYDKIDAEKI